MNDNDAKLLDLLKQELVCPTCHNEYEFDLQYARGTLFLELICKTCNTKKYPTYSNNELRTTIVYTTHFDDLGGD